MLPPKPVKLSWQKHEWHHHLADTYKERGTRKGPASHRESGEYGPAATGGWREGTLGRIHFTGHPQGVEWLWAAPQLVRVVLAMEKGTVTGLPSEINSAGLMLRYQPVLRAAW